VPLLEITPVRKVLVKMRLDERTAIQIDQYAAFLHASADDVVDKALSYVFTKDRDFQEFLKTAEAAGIKSNPRIRSGGQNGPSTDAVSSAGRVGESS
jgi:hypothetical protein